MTAYAGNYVYQNGTLQFFSTPEGYVTPNWQGGYDYVYRYRDHLGNIRLSYADVNRNNADPVSLEIVEESNYYPFGLEHKGYNEGTSPLGNDVAQKWKFGGKEYEDGLNELIATYDFGARNYHPALGRWMNLDPLAEKYYAVSPYTYAADSPLRYVDPNGKEIISINGGVRFTGEDAKLAFQAIKRAYSPDDGSDNVKGIHFVNESRTPSIYEHTLNAFRQGKPNILHYDANKKRQEIRREKAQKNYPSRYSEGLERDEYPYASTFEGGEGALIKYVPGVENSRQGYDLGALYKGLEQGDGFLVLPVPDIRELDPVPVPVPVVEPILNPKDVPDPIVPVVPVYQVPWYQLILNRLPVFLIAPPGIEYMNPYNDPTMYIQPEEL